MAPLDAAHSPLDGRRVIRDINTVGWHVARVPPAGGHHGWAFSVGFAQTFDHPEVAIFGLPDDVLRALLDTIGRHLRAGRTFRDGHEDATLAPPFRFVFRAVDPAWRAAVLPVASWFYGDRSFTAVQSFWPDRAHRLPWEEGFDPDLVGFQPLLFHDDATAARVGPLLASSPAAD
ncbi:MAG: DUF4262 domain-containing protein [Nitrospirota bacterium]